LRKSRHIEFGRVHGLGAAVALAGILAVWVGTALSQGTATPRPEDEIVARKVLMDTIDLQMDQIDWMVTSNKPFNFAEGVERAATISAMLLAFRHLFPPETNRWRAGAKRNPARDTFASPDVWRHFGEFYRRAGEASRIALDASRAKEKAVFVRRFEILRHACNACHAAYVKADN
jgi:cytochrome c556